MSNEQRVALSGLLIVLSILQLVIWLTVFSGACQ